MQPAWFVTRDGDLDCLDMYLRHYSAEKSSGSRTGELFVGPGDKLVLRSLHAEAVFVWRKFTDDCIDERTGERQQGVNCAVFRNEGEHLSSSLIRQADAIADEAWTDRRHYTYVNSEKVASRNPGFCFLAAGWKRCGTTKGGLLIMEKVKPDLGEYRIEEEVPDVGMGGPNLVLIYKGKVCVKGNLPRKEAVAWIQERLEWKKAKP